MRREQPRARELLLERPGRKKVPVLAIAIEDGEQLLPESDDIVTYLRAVALPAAA